MPNVATCLMMLATLAALCVPLPAAKAEIISKTSYKRHEVYGTTPAALISSMNRRSIPRAGSEVVMGLLEMEQDFSYEPIETAQSCRVGSLKTRMDFTIILPHARSRNRFDHDTRRLWRLFVAKVKHHKLTHRRYFLAYANRYEARAKQVSEPTCAKVDTRLAEIAAEEYDRAQHQNEELDRHDGARVDDLPLFVAARHGPEIAENDDRIAMTRRRCLGAD
ncbi:DUF922 domain-containing protein [Breoghania sp.]|uniref:DUF922 domain-containing protein n=1 Tax=Breoghania sp. TaxID=2065378 RepID=UPI002638BED7|nr:DUF922 domain-containing protein [Breoghania sp.]MDJ0929589.1 DUF922 domain-containing protein [Breoghania sp.]